MDRVIRWGIIGTGNIARQFAAALRLLPGNEITGVASRSMERAGTFGTEFAVRRCHEDVSSLVSDAEIDVVYVATPHIRHHDDTMACLRAGKSVLCEKPLAINVREATAMVEYAAQKQLFLMEAMWTRFLPPIGKMLEIVAEGLLGEIQIFTADLGFYLPFNPMGRVFNPNLAGGCLLDVGVYPISLATMLFGEPKGISGRAIYGISGVDEHNSISLTFADGQVVNIFSSIRLETPQQVVLVGTKGTLHMPHHWWKGGPFEVRSAAGTQAYNIPVVGTGYEYEIEEVQRCLLAGQTASNVMPLRESLRVLRITDALRKQWGFRYPTE